LTTSARLLRDPDARRTIMAEQTDMAISKWTSTYTHDIAGNFTSLDDEGERLTGYSADEIVRMNLRDLVVPEQLDHARTMIARLVFEDAVSTAYDLDIVGRKGEVVPLHVEARLAYREGRAFAVEGIARLRA
jgi:PAS domain S-box-containing protein